jgi:predicted PurR-regulated permease PerM
MLLNCRFFPKNEREIKSSLIQVFIQFSFALFLAILYLNYQLFKPYFSPLFWAVLVSIPLRSAKQWFIENQKTGALLSMLSRVCNVLS